MLHCCLQVHLENSKGKQEWELTDREALKDKRKWAPILELSGEKMKELVWKILAVELISKSNGAHTAGCDGQAFKIVGAKAHSNTIALKFLRDSIKATKEILSVAKGKTDQAVYRKGSQGLQLRERWRRFPENNPREKDRQECIGTAACHDTHPHALMERSCGPCGKT